jgi:hypothetical protein
MKSPTCGIATMRPSAGVCTLRGWGLEKTLAELSRELDISPSVNRNWRRFAEAGATTAVQASEDMVPASHLREAYAKIWELEEAEGRGEVNTRGTGPFSMLGVAVPEG